MLSKSEKRVLYLLTKHGGQALRMHITQAMARYGREERERALASVEDLELVSSAKRPPPKGRGAGGTGGLVYWLTDAGREAVDDLIARGEMKHPSQENRH